MEWWEWGVWREGVSSSLSPSWFPEAVVDPTDPVPIKPNPTLCLSGSSAFALIVAAPVVLVGSAVFTIIWKLRYLPSLLPIQSAPARCRAHSAARLKPNQLPHPKELKAHLERMTLTPDVPIRLVSSQSGPRGAKRQERVLEVCLCHNEGKGRASSSLRFCRRGN